MPKVVTGEGLREFLDTGKHQVIEPTKELKIEPKAEVKEAPKEEKKETLRADPVKAEEANKLADELIEADGDLMPEETLEQAKLKINKKHRELKAEKALRKRMQDERDELERLAESQFNERRLVESERDRVKREYEELKGRAAPIKPEPEIKAPDKNDPRFKNDKGEFEWDKFTDAQAEYRVEEFKRAEKAKADEAAKKVLEGEVAKRIAEATKKHPDFVEKLKAYESRRDIPPYITQFMFESEQGAEIAYYFADSEDHYKELLEIAKLSPIKALARLGKLETKFEKVDEKVETKAETKTEVEVRSAPPPITPLSSVGSTPVNTDPSKMNFRELRAYERERRNRN